MMLLVTPDNVSKQHLCLIADLFIYGYIVLGIYSFETLFFFFIFIEEPNHLFPRETR